MARRPRPPISSQGIAGDKRAIPGEHWEMRYNSQQPMDRPEARFDPVEARERPKMYNKINETDH